MASCIIYGTQINVEHEKEINPLINILKCATLVIRGRRRSRTKPPSLQKNKITAKEK